MTMVYDIHTVYSNGNLFVADEQDASRVFTQGLQLIKDCASADLDVVRTNVHDYLELHATVVGSPNIARARSALYVELVSLDVEQILRRLEELINASANFTVRMHQVQDEALARLARMGY